MLGNLSKQVLHVRWLNTLVTTGVDADNVASGAIDCAGYDRIMVTLEVGATAGNTGTLKFFLTDCDTAAGDFAAMTGATIGTHTFGASGEAKKTHIIDTKLSKRYLKINYQREGQNTTIDGGVYMLYNAKQVPITADASVKKLVVV